MIGKIAPKGRGFRGLCAYALRQGRGQIVAGPMAGRTPRELSREFGALRRLNPKLTKAVAHLMLSPAPGDPPLTDSQWQAIADRYIEGMGYAQAPWVGIVHRDTDHQHLHIIACRIGFDGKTVSDANDFRKSEAVVRRLESEFELVSVASPKGIKRKSTPQQANTTTEGAPVMTDTNAMPPNPFNPSDPQHATWPHAYEPGRDLAELAIIDSTPSIVVPSGGVPVPVTTDREREMRRAIVEKGYEAQVQAVFGDVLTRVYRHGGGATLYFRDMGRIADRGSSLQALGDMPDKLAAARIVAMAANPPKQWKTISFTGTDAFLLCAMREARKHRIDIVAVGQDQQEILANVMAEEQGGMGSNAGPATGAAAPAVPVDPILTILSELDEISAQTLPRTAPPLAPVVPAFALPPAPPATPHQPVPAQVLGVLPRFLNLKERIKDRRESRGPAAPAPTTPTAPRKPWAP